MLFNLRSTLLATLILVIATSAAPATFFRVTALSNSAYRYSSSANWDYTISFSISNPNAVFEQGGNAQAACTLNWNSSQPLPTCWTYCSFGYGYFQGQGPAYHVRIPLSGLGSSEEWSVDVREYYVYRNSASNNATVHVKHGENEYWCSNGATTQHCAMTGSVDVGFDSKFSVSPVQEVCQ